MTKFSDFIRNLGTAGPPTLQGIYDLGFALRSELPTLLGKYVRVDVTQSFTDPEKTQGRTNIDAQKLSASLTSLAGLTTAADRLPYTTAANSWAVTTLTAFGRSLLDDADATAARATIGLGNVNNTSDSDKPVSTAQQAALDLKANLASPTLTGTPTAPTAALNTNTTQLATTAFVQANAKGYRSTVFTSSGTWTKPTGLVRVRVTVIGGGGAGGGVGVASATKLAGGGGGAGWSVSEILAASLAATEAVTVGPGGTGVSAATGNVGGSSSFGSLVSAEGGLGGALSNSATPGQGGGIGGKDNVGDRKGYGVRGSAGGLVPTQSGDGGSSLFGGCTPGRTSNGDGVNAYPNTGCGGGGAVDTGTTARVGGNGGSGIVIVEEFF